MEFGFRHVPGQSTDTGTAPSEPSRPFPRFVAGDRLVLVEREQPFDVANQRPDEPPQINDDTDQDEQQDRADGEIKQPYPKRADLETIMRVNDRLTQADLQVSDDDADQRRDAREVRGEVKNVDNQRYGFAGDRRLRGLDPSRSAAGSNRSVSLVASSLPGK